MFHLQDDSTTMLPTGTPPRDPPTAFDGSYYTPPLRHSPSPSSHLYSSSLPSCHQLPPYFSSAASPSFDFPVRRVFSAGDLQGMNGTQTTRENSVNSIQEAGRVGRYSAEERKERIERYRSKRNQRNFHKKITYACRKTLADSRPRVRGRFARNGEIDAGEAIEFSYQSHETYGVYSYDNNNYDVHGYDNSSRTDTKNGGGAEWWRQVEEAMRTEEEEECSFDDDLWANLLGDLSMDLLS